MPRFRVFLRIVLTFVFVLITSIAYAAFDGLSARDRLLVIAPHPDDEILSSAGLIQTALAKGARVKVLYVTNGDKNELSNLIYTKKPLLGQKAVKRSGLMRQREADEAVLQLGLTLEDRVFLGYQDRTLMNLWEHYWSQDKSLKSLTSRTDKVLYEDGYSYQKSFNAPNVLADISAVFLSFRPTIVIMPSPLDIHSDHVATYLFGMIAAQKLVATNLNPQIWCYVIHEVAWPHGKKGYRPNSPLLPLKHWYGQLGEGWMIVPLGGDMRQAKQKAILKYKSQIAYSKRFLLSFVKQNELFQRIPVTGLHMSDANKVLAVTPLAESIRVQTLIDDDLREGGVYQIQVFPHESKTPFEKMPKYSLKWVGRKLYAYRNDKLMKGEAILSESDVSHIRFYMPLRVLGFADKVFVGVDSPSLSKTKWYWVSLT